MTNPIDDHDDDQPVGRLLTRREALALFGTAGAAFLIGAGFKNLHLDQLRPTVTPSATATTVPACIVRPELTEGPYFVDTQLNRSDIRIEPSDNSIKAGVPIRLTFRVMDVSVAGTCAPLPNAQVDIWHCDAAGVYSGVDDPGFDTSDLMFLRGYQITDEWGIAQFISIYPGWYSGRTVHIHFKIRTNPEAETGYEFTSQLFFDEKLSDTVHALPPYSAKGYRDTLNEDDNIFQSSEDLLTLVFTKADIDGEEGYEAIFDIGLDLSDAEVGASDSNAAGGQGGPGGNPPRGTPPSGGRPGSATATPTPR